MKEHRMGLITLYESQLSDAGEFMTIVLIEAIRKLKETDLNPNKVEDWVRKILEKYLINLYFSTIFHIFVVWKILQ